jgi:hypothetical protein
MSASSQEEKLAVGSYRLAVKIKNIVYVIQAAVFKFFCF